MSSYHRAMLDAQPLDLSMKAPPSSQPDEEDKSNQVAPLCLIKDCGCSNHETPASSRNNRPTYGSESAPVDVCNLDGCKSNYSYNENIQWGMGEQYSEVDNSEQCLPGCRFNSPFRPQSVDSPKYYDYHQMSQPFHDSMPEHSGSVWQPPSVNDDRSKYSSYEADTPPTVWRHDPDWNGSPSSAPKIHWRPFTEMISSSPSSQISSSYPMESVPQPVCVASEVNDTDLSPRPGGGKVMILSKSPKLPDRRDNTHNNTSHPAAHPPVTYASTVPLISNSAPIKDSHWPPYSTIRVTRSPKSFHNDGDGDGYIGPGGALKRSQDGSKCGFIKQLQGKENVNAKTFLDIGGQMDDADKVSCGVRMPALDYLISKVLLERIDVPFKPCNAEIKKIYNGERKGRLRLVDLIELQVEESLKA